MSKTFSLLLIVAAACGKSQTHKCEDARDRLLPKMEAALKESLGTSSDRANEQRQGDKELAAFKEQFVGVCAKTDKFPFACVDDLRSMRTDDCKKKLAPVWKQLYGY